MAYDTLPNGELAAVVTYLEMHAPPERNAAPSPLSLQPIEVPQPEPYRVHVHTCSVDHPAALNAYVRAGFTPYRRAIERFPDPRLLGILPADCAPQIPLLGTLA